MSLLKFAQAEMGIETEESIMSKYASNESYKAAIDIATKDSVVIELAKYSEGDGDLFKQAAPTSALMAQLALLAAKAKKALANAGGYIANNASQAYNSTRRHAPEFTRGLGFVSTRANAAQTTAQRRLATLLGANSSGKINEIFGALGAGTGLTVPGKNAPAAVVQAFNDSVHNQAEALITKLTTDSKVRNVLANNIGRGISGGILGGGALLGLGALTEDADASNIFGGLYATPSDRSSWNKAMILGASGALAGGVGGALYDNSQNPMSGQDSMTHKALLGALAGGGAGVFGGALYDNPLD